MPAIIIFPPGVDDATRERTQRFFDEYHNDRCTDKKSAALVNEGICLNVIHNLDDSTPLLLAVLEEHIVAAKMLIAKGLT